MTNNITGEAQRKLTELRAEKQQLDLYIIHLQTSLHLSDRLTRQQYKQLDTIKTIGLRLINIDQYIAYYEQILAEISTGGASSQNDKK